MYCCKHGNCTMLSCCKMNTQKEISDRYIYKICFLLSFIHGHPTEPTDTAWPEVVSLHNRLHMISQLSSFLVISSPHESVTQFGHIWSCWTAPAGSDEIDMYSWVLSSYWRYHNSLITTDFLCGLIYTWYWPDNRTKHKRTPVEKSSTAD